MTRQQQIEAVKDACKAAGDSVTGTYSGRGMYGKTCYGIVCSDPTACIEEAATWGLTGAKVDNMGRDYIVYWPSIAGDGQGE